MGCYRLEGLGAQLFERIEGDYFTVLGLPLWPVLTELRAEGCWRHEAYRRGPAGGIVGRPVAHSLSPVIHNAWIEAAGMDAVYAAFAPPDEAAFDLLIAGGPGGMIRGLNVTVPFKEQALALADEASDTARACGSANVLVFRRRPGPADSTDGVGLLEALAEQAPGFDLTAGPVVVLGAGGAARAAVAALLAGGRAGGAWS